jgi:RNA polymerase sigma factor (sigma-70 family)
MFVQEKVMASAVPELPVLARDQAFEILYRRYVKDVYHYALALLRNPADAEDVTQTTFLNAYRAYKQGIEIEKPHNWLIKICHNVARTRYARASRRVKEVPLEDHVDQLAVPDADQPDVVGVLRALGRLPFNQRAALAMRELEGRSYAEIADTIGVSVPAVETLIFRARRTLRLKASSLRSLAAVPLPTSLTRLFEGGGVVAGGGAAAGTGLVMKAAVAVVAAVVGTGVGGDRSRPATAATPSGTGSVLAPANKGAGDGLKTQQVRNAVRVQESATSKGSHASSATGVGDVTAIGSGTGQATAGQAASSNQVSSNQISSNQAGPVSQVTAPVSDLTSTVQQVVEAPTAALPVQPPSLPTPPIPVPTVPQVPLPPPPVPLP